MHRATNSDIPDLTKPTVRDVGMCLDKSSHCSIPKLPCCSAQGETSHHSKLPDPVIYPLTRPSYRRRDSITSPIARASSQIRILNPVCNQLDTLSHRSRHKKCAYS